MKSKPKLLVIIGPTASGKSDLTVSIAKRFNGEIISADSRQVYRGMDIGTGKVPRDASRKSQIANSYYYKRVPHHLLDVASPKRRFTVAQYKKLAQKAIKKILAKGKIPIICGGTGFYIQAVTENLEIPEVKPDLKLRARLEKIATKELYKKLQKLDPRRAGEIDRFNRRRLIRALEIIYKTGKPVLTLVIPAKAGIQKSEPGFRVTPGMTNTNSFDALFLGIKKSPQELKTLIAQRLQKRLKQGMIAEVIKLHRQGVSWQRLDDFGLEYRWIAKYLQKQISREAMISRLQKEIEHFAKRQMTWFKKNKQINWIANKAKAKRIIEKFLKNKGSAI